MKLKKPSIKTYDVINGEGGLFTILNDEPLDSPVISLRLTQSVYEKLLNSLCDGEKKTDWIRQAIAQRLDRENS